MYIHSSTNIDVPVTAKAVHKATLMREDFVKLSFDADTDYKFKAGDWVELESGGLKYYLPDDYYPTMKDEATFSYELQFNAPWYNLDKVMFLFNTYENGVVTKRESDWYITDNAQNILNLLARATRDRQHSPCSIDLVLSEPTVSKTFTFSSTSIIGALNMLAKDFELEWWFTYENGDVILHFGECDNSVYTVEGEVQFNDGARVKDPTMVTSLVVGGNVTKPSVSQKNGLRRYYYVYGSSRNIDQTVDVEHAQDGFVTSIVTKRLAMANNPQDMIEGSGEEVVIFDDIYPRSDYKITGVTPMEIVTDEVIGYDDGEPVFKRYNVYNLQIEDFSDYVFSLINDPNKDVQNIEDIVASGKPLSIKFIIKDENGQTVTPKLAGFEFEVGATLVTDEQTGDSWYEFQIQHQEINGYIIPNNTLIPEVGDWVCVYNIKGQYIDGNDITNSQTELQEAFAKWYANKKRDVSYTIKPFADGDINLELGDAVELSYSDNVVLSRVSSYEKHLDENIDATYTISSYVKFGSVNQLKDDVKILAASIANGTATGVDLNSLNAYLRRLFLSKVNNDTAAGLITFAQGWETQGFFSNNFYGNGAKVDVDGKGEFEEVNVRGALRAAELIFNLIRAEGGERIESIGYGEIETVEVSTMVLGIPKTGTATLKLDGDEWATIDVGDICRGVYNTLGDDDLYSDSVLNEGQDDNGFQNQKGFFSSYFKITNIITNQKGYCKFTYQLQVVGKSASQALWYNDVATCPHPCPLMKFAVYGNVNDNKRERQSSIYTTAVGIAPRLLFIARVNDWKIKPENIKLALGNIDGLKVNEIVDGEVSLKTLEGDAGLYVEDNIYLGGIINQFTAADWDYIQNKLGNGIHAQLLVGSDNVIIDAFGNVVGGLYTESTDGTTTTIQYKLHTGVIVYDSGKKQYLTIGTAGNLADDEFALYVTANGCTVLQDGADVYVTAISNTANGSTLSDAQLEAMRNTDEFSVDFVVVTANGWRTQMTYPVKITHLDYSYITFDLTNEMDSMSYSTQLRDYTGLPITSTLKAYANGVELSSSDFVSSSMTSNAFTGEKTATHDLLPAVGFFGNASSNGIQAQLTKGGVLTISRYGRTVVDFEDTKYWIDITSVVKYAGVNYTSPAKRFTLTETTDATLYKLLLSANAVLKDEGTYIPSSIDVSVQIISASSSAVYTASQLENSGNIKVRYLIGTYDPSWSKATLINSWLTSQPNFSNVPTCMTVLVVDNSDVQDPIVLDVESVTINAKGRDGAGQPWVKVNPQQLYIDCNENGEILETKQVTFSANLYWGEQLCVLDNTACEIGFSDDVSTTPSYSPSTNPISALRSYEFRQGDTLESKELNIYLLGSIGNDTHSASTTVSVIPNKKGSKGDDGAAGAAVRFRGAWNPTEAATNPYVWNSTFRDCVKYNSQYWLVAEYGTSLDEQDEPDSQRLEWQNIGGMRFVATELLLAENAVIDLLYSNVIRMRNASGTLTATINEDQHGSYRIYYPSGKKMMEFSHEGYIYYYNDDSDNTVAWFLGHGGDIKQSESDDWTPVELAFLGGGVSIPSVEVLSTSTWSRSTRWKFKAGTGSQFSPNDGQIFTDKPTNNNPSSPTPDTVSVISNGWYTPNSTPFQKINDEGTSMMFSIMLYKVESGRITQTWTRTNLGNNEYLNEQDV